MPRSRRIQSSKGTRYLHTNSDYPELTSKTVISRVLKNYATYATRNKAKEATKYEQENMNL